MVRLWFLDPNGVISGATDYPTAMIPAGLTAAEIPAAFNPRSGGTWINGVYTAPVSPYANPASLDDRLSLYHAHLHWTQHVRRSSWASLRARAPLAIDQDDLPLKATDRWAFVQIALGDRLARGEWPLPPNTFTDVQRRAAIDHIITVITSLGYVWYEVMRIGNQGSLHGDAASWADTQGIGSNAAIYSDIITAAGMPFGPDGGFQGRVIPGATIRPGFDIESTTLD